MTIFKEFCIAVRISALQLKNCVNATSMAKGESTKPVRSSICALRARKNSFTREWPPHLVSEKTRKDSIQGGCDSQAEFGRGLTGTTAWNSEPIGIGVLRDIGGIISGLSTLKAGLVDRRFFLRGRSMSSVSESGRSSSEIMAECRSLRRFVLLTERCFLHRHNVELVAEWKFGRKQEKCFCQACRGYLRRGVQICG